MWLLYQQGPVPKKVGWFGKTETRRCGICQRSQQETPVWVGRGESEAKWEEKNLYGSDSQPEIRQWAKKINRFGKTEGRRPKVSRIHERQFRLVKKVSRGEREEKKVHR